MIPFFQTAIVIMISNLQARKVAIVGYNRIPFSRSNGPYAEASNQDMMVAALNGLIERWGSYKSRLETAAWTIVGRSGRRGSDQA